MAAEGVLFCIGNPLLDISANVEPSMLEKYELKANDAILAEDKHQPIYEELQKGQVDYVAGGATQNSARVAQGLLKEKGTLCYSGCIGDDAAGKQIKACADACGMATCYQIDAETPTGQCGVLITDGGKARSLVTSLGAANNFKHEHAETEEMKAAIDKAQFYYTAGFFQTVSPQTVIHIGKHAAETNKTFTTNLSPPFLEAIKNTIPYADIIFGNE